MRCAGRRVQLQTLGIPLARLGASDPFRSSCTHVGRIDFLSVIDVGSPADMGISRECGWKWAEMG